MIALSAGHGAPAFEASPLRGAPLSIAWSVEGDKAGYLLPDGDGLAFCTLSLRGRKTCYVRGVPRSATPTPTPTSPPVATPTPTPTKLQTPTPTSAPRVTPPPNLDSGQDPKDPVLLYQAVISASDGQAPDVSQGLRQLDPPKATPTPKALQKPTPRAQTNTPKPEARGIPEVPFDLRGYIWRPGGEDILLNDGGDLTLLTLETGATRPLTRTPAIPEFDPQFTADGSGLIYLAGGHLYWLTLFDGNIRRLSQTPIPDLYTSPYGPLYRALYAPRESEGLRVAPKGGYIAYLTLTPPNQSASQGVAIKGAGQKPGDRLPQAGVRVVDSGGRIVFSDDLKEEGYILPAFAFTPDGRSLAYMILDRPQDTLKVMLADLSSGETTLLFEETMPHFYPPPEAPYFLPKGREYIWMSPYYGFHQPHLGTVSKAPERPKRLLRDPWNLDFQGIDERGRWMYLVGSGEVPTERYLYRMHPTGGGLTRMTLRWGWHDVLVSPGGAAFVDTFSDPNTPPVTSIWRDRERVGVMEDRRAALKNTTPGSRKLLRFEAEDGQQLFADMRLPPSPSPAPVVIRLVTGPGEQSVTKAYLPDPLTLRLVQGGVGVVTLDTRGTGGRMHRFSTAIDGAPGTAELGDLRALISRLGKEPGVDVTRVVLLGEGYGALKVLKAFEGGIADAKGAVAISPLTDLSQHLAPIGERYLGQPRANAAGYAQAKVDAEAIAERGPVMIVVGDGEGSIDPSQGARLLQEAYNHPTPPRLLWVPGASQPLIEDPSGGRYVVDQIVSFIGDVLGSP